MAALAAQRDILFSVHAPYYISMSSLEAVSYTHLDVYKRQEYKGDVVNILVCGIDFEEGRSYSDASSNDGMTDMILYCQFDIKGWTHRDTYAKEPQSGSRPLAGRKSPKPDCRMDARSCRMG